ncbi:hypothetical protein G5V58_21605 [Nocardioides anomalus]|uniref:Uncharacterized protein n=1 Tax=Nocardioides anomalus TaxID=2712223 RepID=A0A6G6WIH1_9ACTN|nr:hypothetical protein [Nocardioides anomalus]QIG45019.1 hypothetical protein G5V58_21605 [Nocardioides anomalus]
MANLFGDIAAMVDRLVEFGISESLAAQLKSFLTDSADQLTDQKPNTVSHTAFGGTPGSVQLASDAGKARAHVVEALKDMASGLDGYGQIIHQLYVDAKDTDDAAEADFIAQTKKADSMIPVSFAAAHPHSHGHGGHGGGS